MKVLRERTETEPLEIDLRGNDGESKILSGLAVPYKRWSEKLGWFTERIHPGASAKTLRESKDIACLFNHNNDKILGRTSSGTLILDERPGGVYYENTLGNQSYAKDLDESIRRKDIQGNSFAFMVPEGKEKWTEEGDSITRDVYEIQLFEVGPQVFPAYSQTSVKVRSVFGLEDDTFDSHLLAKAQFFSLKNLTLPERDAENLFDQFRTMVSVFPKNNPVNFRFLTDFITQVSRGTDQTNADKKHFQDVIDLLRSYITEPGNHSGADDEPGDHSTERKEEFGRVMRMRERELQLLSLAI